MNVKKHYIYGLVCPDINEVRYIGLSKDPDKRLIYHMTAQEKDRCPEKNKWIRNLKRRKLKPTVVIIDRVNLDRAYVTERFWIYTYHYFGAKLLNVRKSND